MEGGGGLEGSRNDVSFRGYQAKGNEKRQGEGGGVINSEKWADVVYGWPLKYPTFEGFFFHTFIGKTNRNIKFL